MSTNLQPHPYADVFPMLSEPELQTLSDDIKKNGLQEPIILHEGKILDGRNRYSACTMAGVTPIMKHYQGKNPSGFVASVNLHRRHMNEGQRAIAAAKLLELANADAKVEKMLGDEQSSTSATDTSPNSGVKPIRKGPPKKAVTIDKIAREFNVGIDSVKKATRIMKKSPEKAKEVAEGKKRLHKADREIKRDIGTLTPLDEAKQLGNVALNALKKVPREFRHEIYDRIRLWMESNVEIGDQLDTEHD